MTRRAVTLIELLVVVAIVATLLILIVGAMGGQRRTGTAPPSTVQMVTVQHDRHWWILCRDHFAHHPDCPCHDRTAEAEVK